MNINYPKSNLYNHLMEEYNDPDIVTNLTEAIEQGGGILKVMELLKIYEQKHINKIKICLLVFDKIFYLVHSDYVYEVNYFNNQKYFDISENKLVSSQDLKKYPRMNYLRSVITDYNSFPEDILIDINDGKLKEGSTLYLKCTDDWEILFDENNNVVR